MTLEQLFREIDQLEEKVAADGGELWFRGEGNPCWQLRSSLHRTILQSIPDVSTHPAAKQEEIIRDLAKTYYHRYRSQAWPLLQPAERSKWGLVFSMQHYGLPTRLLDWTESLAVALYFALADAQPDTPIVVYVLDPEGLSAVRYGSRGLVAVPGDDEPVNTDIWAYHPVSVKAVTEPLGLPPIAVVPFWSNPRMVAQRSTFVLAGDFFDPLEQAVPTCVWRFALDPATLPEVQRFLRRAGVNRPSVFPELPSIAKSIRERTK